MGKTIFWFYSKIIIKYIYIIYSNLLTPCWFVINYNELIKSNKVAALVKLINLKEIFVKNEKHFTYNIYSFMKCEASANEYNNITKLIL